MKTVGKHVNMINILQYYVFQFTKPENIPILKFLQLTLQYLRNIPMKISAS